MTSDDDSPTGVAPTELAASITETEAVTAWALDDGEEWTPPRRLTPGRITAAAVAASLALVSVSGVLAWRHLRDEEPATAEAPATSMTPATLAPVTTTARPVDGPPRPPAPAELDGVDGEFIAEMRGFGVPVSDKDPQWTADLAHAVCATARDGQPNRYPPGVHTVIELTEGVMHNNPDWTRQQATRFTDGAVNFYCPDVWGPSQEEIAAMPPDARYLAILQDRLGATPVNDSLVRAAHEICGWRSQGWSIDRIVDGIDSPNPREDEQVIAETAIDVYCPQYSGR